LSDMNENEQLITRFYSAFQRRDYKTMQDCYADKVIFYDPVFEDLIDEEVKLMWEMLCKRANDLSIEFNQAKADEEYGTCNWVASYTFTKTNRKVVNTIKAHMRFRDGKIIEHSDQFKLSHWCRQALGLRGVLFGSTAWFQTKVRKSAQQSLYDYIIAKKNPK
jgi:ketosteroid isomerase-like protein